MILDLQFKTILKTILLQSFNNKTYPMLEDLRSRTEGYIIYIWVDIIIIIKNIYLFM